MKNVFFTLFALLVFASCKKDKVSGDSGCIGQARILHFYVPPADSAKARQLLTQNHLPINDLEVEYVILHDTITQNNSANVYQYVYAVQYFKGLPILSSDFGYEFKEGVFQKVTGVKYNNINLDTHSTLSLSRIRSVFIDQLRKYQGNNVAVAFKDSCLEAQFGYYDLNARAIEPHNTNFVKAWLVRPKNKLYPWPEVLLRDDNGAVIVYYGGITTKV
jgi:hypothetical protein